MTSPKTEVFFCHFVFVTIRMTMCVISLADLRGITWACGHQVAPPVARHPYTQSTTRCRTAAWSAQITCGTWTSTISDPASCRIRPRDTRTPSTPWGSSLDSLSTIARDCTTPSLCNNSSNSNSSSIYRCSRRVISLTAPTYWCQRRSTRRSA